MDVKMRAHPQTLYARMQNQVQLILRLENKGETRYVEAEVRVPEKLSLAPNTRLNEGRIRAGIVEKGEALEKSVRIYASAYTDAQAYPIRIIVFTYDKDAVIDERIELLFELKAEEQKPAVL